MSRAVVHRRRAADVRGRCRRSSCSSLNPQDVIWADRFQHAQERLFHDLNVRSIHGSSASFIDDDELRLMILVKVVVDKNERVDRKEKRGKKETKQKFQKLKRQNM